METIYTPVELHVQGAARSDKGRIRSNNEDACIADPDLGLYAVADGMGGHAGGEIASQMAIEMLRVAAVRMPDRDYLRVPSAANRRALLAWLARAVEEINAALLDRAQRDQRLHGMGCTLDAVLVRGSGVFIAHVGDSRIYALRNGALHQLTEDHNLGHMLRTSGGLTEDEVARHPQRNVLTRALGPFSAVQVDTSYMDLAAGDIFLLCSDGLHSEVGDAGIQQILAGPAAEAPATLVQAALDAGGRDNVSAVVVTVQTCPPGQALIGSQEARAALSRSPLFSTLSESELLRVQKIATAREIHAGEVVVAQGASCADLYMTVAGTFTVTQDDLLVGVLAPGDPFGAVTLLDLPSAVAVRAQTDGQLLSFPLEDVLELFTSDPPVAAKLARGALQRTGERLANVSATLARYRRAARELAALDAPAQGGPKEQDTP